MPTLSPSSSWSSRMEHSSALSPSCRRPPGRAIWPACLLMLEVLWKIGTDGIPYPSITTIATAAGASDWVDGIREKSRRFASIVSRRSGIRPSSNHRRGARVGSAAEDRHRVLPGSHPGGVAKPCRHAPQETDRQRLLAVIGGAGVEVRRRECRTRGPRLRLHLGQPQLLALRFRLARPEVQGLLLPDAAKIGTREPQRRRRRVDVQVQAQRITGRKRLTRVT